MIIFIFFSLLTVYFYKFFIFVLGGLLRLLLDSNAQTECPGFTQRAQILSSKDWLKRL